LIVKLDLRPESEKNVRPPKTRKIGLLMFCMLLIFTGVVCFVWFSMVVDIMSLNTNISSLNERNDEYRTIKVKLEAELRRLAQQEAVYVSSLSIMHQDLPTIEVFDSIDRSLARGVTLVSMTLSQPELKLNGVANTEDNIVTTTRSLLDSGTFSTAQVPVVNRTDMGPEGLRFTLSLAPLEIGRVNRK